MGIKGGEVEKWESRPPVRTRRRPPTRSGGLSPPAALPPHHPPPATRTRALTNPPFRGISRTIRGRGGRIHSRDACIRRESGRTCQASASIRRGSSAGR